jgi:hypothetical protein
MQAELDELLALYRGMTDEQKQQLMETAQELIKEQQKQATD